MSTSQFRKGESGNKEGRPKGIKDKRTLYYDIKAQLEARGYDPIAAHIELAINGETQDVRYRANKDLIDRITPTLKSIEHKGEIGTYYVLNVGLKNG